MANNQYFIGLMSGTSLDGIDVALIQTSRTGSIKLIDFKCVPLTKSLAEQLAQVSIADQINLEQMGQLSVALAKLCAAGCNDILQINDLTAEQVTAIGSHGVTIRHRPELEHSFTLQITDPNTLAALTGIDVVADLRGMDMAFGGQGAPLVPKFHQALLANTSAAQQGIFLNLGGIANITVIEQDKPVLGYDTGPANTLMNLWCKQHTGEDYDHNGNWAKTGKVSEQLLTSMLADPYFSIKAPKSTGKEKFNLVWLEQMLDCVNEPLAQEDVQATLLMLTAKSVAEQIEQFNVKQLYLCGGGAQNLFLVETLQQLLPSLDIKNTSALGVESDAIEAMAFAWFAYCRVNNIVANVPSVTGANSSVVLGAWYSAGGKELN